MALIVKVTTQVPQVNTLGNMTLTLTFVLETRLPFFRAVASCDVIIRAAAMNCGIARDGSAVKVHEETDEQENVSRLFPVHGCSQNVLLQDIFQNQLK
jgi:hypothetical protein